MATPPIFFLFQLAHMSRRFLVPPAVALIAALVLGGAAASCAENSTAPGTGGAEGDGGPLAEGGVSEAGEVLGCPVVNDPLYPSTDPSPSTDVGIRALYSGVPFRLATDAIISWTATDAPGQTGGGTFAAPSSSETTFTCTCPGDVTLTVHLGLAGTSCDFASSWVVHCHI